MKPFLSKEQAEFLREKLFDSTMLQTRQVGVSRYMDWPDVVGEINQCTEKEFPAYITDAVKLRADNQFGFPVMMTMPAMHHHFNLEGFKAFTAGCVKICGWLEEQE